MKRSQVSVFVILSLLIILAVYFIFTLKQNTADSLENQIAAYDSSEFRNTIEWCSRQTVVKANAVYGIRLETEEAYIEFFRNELTSCMQYILKTAEAEGFEVEGGTAESAERSVNDKSIVMKTVFPTRISQDDFHFDFHDYSYTFDLDAIHNVDTSDPIESEDRIMTASFSGSLLQTYNGSIVRKVNIRVMDNSGFEDPNLLGNLVYEISPEDCFSNDTFTVSLNLAELNISERAGLSIGWWDTRVSKWGYFTSRVVDSTLIADVQHTNIFGVIKTSDLTPADVDEENQNPDMKYTSYNDAGSGNPQVYSGADYVIFTSLKEEMYSQYNIQDIGFTLTLDPQCVQGLLPNVYCITGSRCGILGVHCDPRLLPPMGESAKNMLLRHEITHTIQDINGATEDSMKNEWGADYIAGSSYYRFLLNGQKMTAQQVAGKMSDNGCTSQDLTDAALGRENRNSIWDACLNSKGDAVTW